MNTLWATKIANANKYYKQWEDRFKCQKLEDYWEGYQWTQIIDIPYYRPYVVNLVYAELKKKLANILYQNLQFNCTPRPGNFNINPEMAMILAQNKQDFLNEITARANVDNDFNDTIKLCAMDSFFRFMVMEVGYAADWRNPNKTPLITKAQTEEDFQGEESKAKVVLDEEVPENERIYYKRIKPARFRVSLSDDNKLHNCSWTGYYAYPYKRVLEKTKGLKLPKDFDKEDAGYNSDYIGASGYIGARISATGNAASADSRDILELLRQGKVCKVWHTWNNETKMRQLLLEPGFDVIWEAPFNHLPFVTHRHDFRLDGWYPIPPVYQWITSQDEVNQSREMMRNYRRRFTRKFRFWGIDQEEIEKFKTETDGEVIKMKSPNSTLEPIGNPEIGISILDGLNAARDDFNTVSGSSSDLTTTQRDRTTATQSKITAMKAQIIESVEQLEFEKVYKKIARLTLIEAHDHFTSGIWVKNSMDPMESFLGQIDPNRIQRFKYIQAQDLGSDGFDADIEISCVNASPAKMQEEFDKFIKFLTTVNGFPQIAMSPILIREAAYRVGYHNEKVIAAMQQSAMLIMLGQAQNAANATGNNLGQMLGGANGATGNMMRNASPASQEAIDTQLMSQ